MPCPNRRADTPPVMFSWSAQTKERFLTLSLHWGRLEEPEESERLTSDGAADTEIADPQPGAVGFSKHTFRSEP